MTTKLGGRERRRPGGETTAGGILPMYHGRARATRRRQPPRRSRNVSSLATTRSAPSSIYQASINRVSARERGSRRTRASPFFSSRSSPTRDVVVVVGGGETTRRSRRRRRRREPRSFVLGARLGNSRRAFGSFYGKSRLLASFAGPSLHLVEIEGAVLGLEDDDVVEVHLEVDVKAGLVREAGAEVFPNHRVVHPVRGLARRGVPRARRTPS